MAIVTQKPWIQHGTIQDKHFVWETLRCWQVPNRSGSLRSECRFADADRR